MQSISWLCELQVKKTDISIKFMLVKSCKFHTSSLSNIENTSSPGTAASSLLHEN